MVVLDTNVLLAASDADAHGHPACLEAIQRLRSGHVAWHSTWGVLYEFLRVSTHRRVLRQPYTTAQACDFVAALLAAPSFSVLEETDRHVAALRAVLDEDPELRGSVLHDVHTAVLMREHGVRKILTRDTGFHRFPWIEVVDPLRAASR